MPPSTVDPPSASIPELLPCVCEGSLPHLRELGARLPRNFTPSNAAGILEALFASLSTPTGFELGPNTSATTEQLAAPMEAFSSLTKVARWSIANPSTRPSILTFRVLSNSQGSYIFWALHALGLKGSATSDTSPTLQRMSRKHLEMFGIVASFFHALSQLPNNSFQELASREEVIDIALVLWVITYEGHPPPPPPAPPPIYPSGSRGREDDLDQEDEAMTIFAKVTEINTKDVVASIMDERVCGPEVFVERTIARMAPLADLKLIRRLSHFGPVTVEVTSMRHVVQTTQYIIEAEPLLHELFMQKDAFPTYIGVVATIAAKYDSRTMGLLMLRREPAEAIMRRWNGYIVAIVPMSSAIFEMSLSFPRSTVQNMTALIAGVLSRWQHTARRWRSVDTRG
ncbi:hypothetical protein FA13DRAFT_1816287 [Coprinellus micaceus]|uniref:Uncharacterized protein n=1 Tax=Coprinellus micaceus TaxID=71717 RepID=A0A4Y7T0A0_COPMI|nr:hypothetical protein FA13DRAFT_1816287 [Coprinellus micaceus]